MTLYRFCAVLSLNALTLLIAVSFTLGNCSPLFAADPPPGGLVLLPGYTHEALQGIDSRPGKISKPGGLTIHYDIGRIPKPGGFRLGGDFTDSAKNTPAASRKWYREQTINNEPVHLAYTKTNRLLVSYPTRGINFSVEITNADQMADALLMLLSVPNPEPKKT